MKSSPLFDSSTGTCRGLLRSPPRCSSGKLHRRSEAVFQPGPEPFPIDRLLLVGTVHSDPHGYRTTLQLLERLGPQLMLVELSPFGLAFRRTQQRLLYTTLHHNLRRAAASSELSLRQALQHPQIRSICRQLSLPFEYRAAAHFAQRSSSQLVLVDDSGFSRHWIATWPELLAVENLRYLLGLPATRPSMNTAYAAAATSISQDAPSQALTAPCSRPDGARWANRERFMAGQVAHNLRVRQPDSAIYLGGWQHLTQGGAFPTLRQILKIPRNRCVVLGESGICGQGLKGEGLEARG